MFCDSEPLADLRGRRAERVFVDGDHREPVGRLAERRVRAGTRCRRRRERVAVARVDRAATRHLVVQRCELTAAERGEQVAHAVVEADLGVLVVRRGVARLGGEVARLRSTYVGSWLTSIPPPLVVITLLPLNENTLIAPNEPAGSP